jgi:hypothetical protein
MKERFMKSLCFKLFCSGLLLHVFTGFAAGQAQAPAVASASRGSGFRVDVRGAIDRSDVILGRPNLVSAEAMPLGNGRLGVAVLSANGFTAQLNRNDTLPDRLAAGQLEVPGLVALTSAGDYAGEPPRQSDKYFADPETGCRKPDRLHRSFSLKRLALGEDAMAEGYID